MEENDSEKKECKENFPSAGGHPNPKEEAIRTQLRFLSTCRRLDESYEASNLALTTLFVEYEKSKEVRNLFTRHPLLKAMIKEVLELLKTKDWALMEVPRQEKREADEHYVLRTCAALEKALARRGEKAVVANEEPTSEQKERFERLTSEEIEAENAQLSKDLCGILKRFAALRKLIKELATEYSASKYYPIIPRYILLKDMVKIARENYADICQQHKIM
jgi:hypothetical protein